MRPGDRTTLVGTLLSYSILRAPPALCAPRRPHHACRGAPLASCAQPACWMRRTFRSRPSARIMRIGAPLLCIILCARPTLCTHSSERITLISAPPFFLRCSPLVHGPATASRWSVRVCKRLLQHDLSLHVRTVLGKLRSDDLLRLTLATQVLQSEISVRTPRSSTMAPVHVLDPVCVRQLHGAEHASGIAEIVPRHRAWFGWMRRTEHAVFQRHAGQHPAHICTCLCNLQLAAEATLHSRQARSLAR